MAWWTWWTVFVGAVVACVPPDPPAEGAGVIRTGHSAGLPASGEGGTQEAPSLPRLASSGAATEGLAPQQPTSGNPTNDAPIAVGEPFHDTFERDALGPDYRVTSGAWRLEGGRLCARNARNQPVWLRRQLPLNARIEFAALSRSVDGDLKVEVWGDGRSGASGVSYDDATGYLAILGGWKNRLHVLARLDEHGDDRLAIPVDPRGGPRSSPVIPDRIYRFALERADGRSLRWQVDGFEVARLEDPEPLAGTGHDHFGFNDWEAEVCFDDLVITAL